MGQAGCVGYAGSNCWSDRHANVKSECLQQPHLDLAEHLDSAESLRVLDGPLRTTSRLRFVDPVEELPVPSIISAVWNEPYVVFTGGMVQIALEWYKMPFALAHETLRHEMMRIVRLVEVMSGSSASFAAFAEYFERYVLQYTVMHQQFEEEVLFPAISGRVALPAELGKERQCLDALYSAPLESAEARDLAGLQHAVSSLCAALDDHMTWEESTIVPLIEAHCTKAWLDRVLSFYPDWEFAHFNNFFLVASVMTENAARVCGLDQAFKARKSPYTKERSDEATRTAIALEKFQLMWKVVA